MGKKWMAAHYIKTTAKQTRSRNLNHMHMKTTRCHKTATQLNPQSYGVNEGTKLLWVSLPPSFHQTSIHFKHTSCKHSQDHSLTVCPQLPGPRTDPWVLTSRRMKVQQPWRGRSPALSPTANQQRRPLLVRGGRLGLLGQPANREVINHLLDLLHVVLEAVVALPQGVVLQVEQAEA